MKLRYFWLVLFLIANSKAFALSRTLQSMDAVHGHIDISDSSISPTRVTVVQFIKCYQGITKLSPCGEKESSAQVDAAGNFHLDKLQGDDEKWFRGGYRVSLDGNPLFYCETGDVNLAADGKALHDFLQNLTLFHLKDQTVEIKTDTGVTYEDWMKNENHNYEATYSITLANKNQSGIPYAVLPHVTISYLYKLKSAHQYVGDTFYLLAGNLTESPGNYSANLVVKSRGEIGSMVMVDRKIGLNDPALYTDLGNILLETKKINHTFAGLWDIGLSLVEMNFIPAEPKLFASVQCQNQILTGTMDLVYRTHPKLNKQLPISGSCGFAVARFGLTWVAFDFPPEKNKSQEVNWDFLISDISHSDAVVNILDRRDGKIYSNYSGAERCKGTYLDSEGYLECDLYQ